MNSTKGQSVSKLWSYLCNITYVRSLTNQSINLSDNVCIMQSKTSSPQRAMRIFHLLICICEVKQENKHKRQILFNVSFQQPQRRVYILLRKRKEPQINWVGLKYKKGIERLLIRKFNCIKQIKYLVILNTNIRWNFNFVRFMSITSDKAHDLCSYYNNIPKSGPCCCLLLNTISKTLCHNDGWSSFHQ